MGFAKAPSGRELPTESGEGERVTMKLTQTQSHAGSFHHFVVPLPLGGRLSVVRILRLEEISKMDLWKFEKVRREKSGEKLPQLFIIH